jgi:hypothetical protein
MRKLLGVDYPPVFFDVDNSAIRLWAMAAGYTDPVFYDDEEARRAGHPAIPAPPGFLGHERYAPGAEIGSKGPPIRGLNPRLTRSLNAGTEYEYLATVYAGDVLEATTRIVDFQERSGSIGEMLIISRETTYRRNDDIVAIVRAKAINY